jgi:hypothetical protein
MPTDAASVMKKIGRDEAEKARRPPNPPQPTPKKVRVRFKMSDGNEIVAIGELTGTNPYDVHLVQPVTLQAGTYTMSIEPL